MGLAENLELAKNLEERSIKAAKKFLARRGAKVIDFDLDGYKNIDTVCVDEGKLVFVVVTYTVNEPNTRKKKFKECKASRNVLEEDMINCLVDILDEYPELDELPLRFDEIALCIFSESQAALRRHTNILA